MKVSVELLTAPSSDTGSGSAILVHFATKRYLFGHVSEGSVRAFIERRSRLQRVGDIFVSGRTDWESVGGLSGLILALDDQDANSGQKRGLVVHGGENLMHSVAIGRCFVFRMAMNLAIHETAKGEEFSDENVRVRTLHINPEEGYHLLHPKEAVGEAEGAAEALTGGAEVAEQPLDRREMLAKVVADMFCSAWTMDTMDEDGPPVTEDEARDPQLSARLPPPGKRRAPWPASLVPALPRSKPSQTSLSYILTLREVRGKFLPQKALSLGVEAGPDFSKLASGQSVATADGRVVRPEEVMEPPKAGTGIAVCDVPAREYVHNFVNHPEWTDREAVQRRTGCFFYILGPGVAEDPRMRAFMAQFPNSRHVLSSPDVCPDVIVFKGTAKATTLLNHLDSSCFPTLHCATSAPQSASWEGSPPNVTPAQVGWRFEIEPKWAADDSGAEPPFSASEIMETKATPSFLAAAAEAQKALASLVPEDVPGANVEIYPLGTGSATPSKYRNVSATLVRIPGAGSLLLDCGENTLSQLKRLFGTGPELNAVLRDIKLVYISHLHADHHMGTVSVLKARWQLGEKTTHVIGEKKMHLWLKEYRDVECYGWSTVAFTPAESLYPSSAGETVPPPPPPSSNLQHLYSALKLRKIETALAVHCMGSHTAAFTFEDGFKLAYSGDTQPVQTFVDIGRGATVLIHEATFEDGMEEEARLKKHSTVSQALQVAREMDAWGVVLTHFSQRYPKAALLGTGSGAAEVEERDVVERDRQRVVMAFDCMRIRVGEMGRFALLREGLSRVFEDTGEGGEAELEDAGEGGEAER